MRFPEFRGGHFEPLLKRAVEGAEGGVAQSESDLLVGKIYSGPSRVPTPSLFGPGSPAGSRMCLAPQVSFEACACSSRRFCDAVGLWLAQGQVLADRTLDLPDQLVLSSV